MSEHICKYCGESFAEGYQLGNHVAHLCALNPNRGKRKSFNGRTYSWTCRWCNAEFPTRRSMQTHRKCHYDTAENRQSIYSHVIPLATDPCKYCGKIFKTMSGLHWHERCCDNNPQRIYLPKQSEIMTDDTKQKISAAMKKYYAGKTIWYTSLHHRESYAERYFSKIFKNAERNFHVDRYFVDFAWPKSKIYIEIDGEQHYTTNGIERDIIRTNRLHAVGWTLVKRIRWSEYQKLDKSDRKQYIRDVLELLNTMRVDAVV